MDNAKKLFGSLPTPKTAQKAQNDPSTAKHHENKKSYKMKAICLYEQAPKKLLVPHPNLQNSPIKQKRLKMTPEMQKIKKNQKTKILQKL